MSSFDCQVSTFVASRRDRPQQDVLGAEGCARIARGAGSLRSLVVPLCLSSLLGIPGVSHALELANALSSTLVTCGSSQSLVTKAGEALEDCLVTSDSFYSPATASVRTVLGARPTASVTATNVGEAGKFKLEAQASAHLTYEIRLVALTAPPVSLTSIPVKVAVVGEVKRDSQRADATISPLAIGSAWVTMRSDSAIPWANGDVLNERAVRTPRAPSQDTPDFDKSVGISLAPGHTYLVDLVAGCRLSGSSVNFETVASRSGCSAMADPVFSFDQAALDTRLGSSSFSLASYYSFEYSDGVGAPVPEPQTVAMMLLGLLALAGVARRRA